MRTKHNRPAILHSSEDLKFYRKLRRGLIESRGTEDWQFDLIEFQMAAMDEWRSAAFRCLVVRHLTRLRLAPAELVKPDWKRIIAEEQADGSMI